MTITAKVIQHSTKEDYKSHLVTFELEYPRFIHGELMTHRVFSRNAASSRAIPISKMIEQVRYNPATPIHWGANQPGMQANREVENVKEAKLAWKKCALDAAKNAEILNEAGLHKQVVNRILEPFQTMKTVVTTTELDNFFDLRIHEDAQPEIKCLAEKMEEAFLESCPFPLYEGEWHLPYVDRRFSDDKMYYYSNGKKIPEEVAIQISASCCAQVSYRLLDDSEDKAKKIYKQLVESKPIHASPFEHQAMCVKEKGFIRNFKGWKQHRVFIEEQL